VWASSVRLIDDRTGNGGNNSGWGSRVNFAGSIARVEGRTLWVRGDNGQTYKVLYNGNTSFRTGDRVRVVGTYSDGAVTATSINR
jgi:outer membrane lipoprotein SlyB